MILQSLKKVWWSILSRNRPLTASECAFIAENRRFWEPYSADQEAPADEYLLVTPEIYPLILIGNAQIASVVARQKQLRLLFLLAPGTPNSRREVLGSYPNSAFVNLGGVLFRICKRVARMRARIVQRRLTSPDEFLMMEVDGLRLGNLVYDTCLSRGKTATLRETKTRTVRDVLAEVFYYRLVLQVVLKRFSVKAALQSHMMGVGGWMLRMLVSSGVEVWIRAETLKKYNSPSMFCECSRTPASCYIDFMKENREIFLPMADKCLSERMTNARKDMYDHIQYGVGKKLFSSSDDFARSQGLPPGKPNVFVMLHAFNDYPHTYGDLLHRDYYEWFIDVLQVARETDSVNWIFKEHPYAALYPAEDFDLATFFDSEAAPHIAFMDRDANFSTASLAHVAHLIATCIGSAGLEFSAFGVPCVLCGKSWYSGWGFTYEPTTVDEFHHLLRNAAEISRLTDKQIEMAKLLALFTFDIVDLPRFPDPFRTQCTYNHWEQKSLSADQMLDRIVEWRKRSTEEEKQAYVAAIREFAADDTCMQFVDLDRLPMFRGVTNRNQGE